MLHGPRPPLRVTPPFAKNPSRGTRVDSLYSLSLSPSLCRAAHAAVPEQARHGAEVIACEKGLEKTPSKPFSLERSANSVRGEIRFCLELFFRGDAELSAVGSEREPAGVEHRELARAADEVRGHGQAEELVHVDLDIRIKRRDDVSF